MGTCILGHMHGKAEWAHAKHRSWRPEGCTGGPTRALGANLITVLKILKGTENAPRRAEDGTQAIFHSSVLSHSARSSLDAAIASTITHVKQTPYLTARRAFEEHRAPASIAMAPFRPAPSSWKDISRSVPALLTLLSYMSCTRPPRRCARLGGTHVLRRCRLGASA
jgi:hypothetical protein